MADEVIPSFNEQLRTLRKGRSLSKTERFPVGKLPEEGINAYLSNMRKNINALVSRQRDPELGRNYKVESFSTLTNDNEAMLLGVAITRI